MNQETNPLGWMIWFFIVAILAMFVVVWIAIDSEMETDPAPRVSTASPSAPPKATPSYEQDDVGAWTMCQMFAEDRLHAPSTAKWPWSYRDRVEYLGNKRYRIRTHFDAQNAFGAMIRGQMDCTVRDEGETWALELMHIE